MENKLVSEIKHGQTEKRLDFENLRKKRENGDDSTKAIIILSNFEWSGPVVLIISHVAIFSIKVKRAKRKAWHVGQNLRHNHAMIFSFSGNAIY